MFRTSFSKRSPILFLNSKDFELRFTQSRAYITLIRTKFKFSHAFVIHTVKTSGLHPGVRAF